MKKRTLVLVSLVLTILIFFTACGKKDAKNPNAKTGKKYIIAVDLIYPPFSFKENNVDKGIDEGGGENSRI